MVNIPDAIEVGEDIASASKDPLTVLKDAMTLYRTYQDIHTLSGSPGSVVKEMDARGELVPTVQAVVDIAPILLTMLKNPAEKAKLIELVASV